MSFTAALAAFVQRSGAELFAHAEKRIRLYFFAAASDITHFNRPVVQCHALVLKRAE
jgi:hypothetical protein